MRVLLDTHIFIWWNGDLKLLSPAARAICEDEKNILMLSLVSVWEMQIKTQLGKIVLKQPLAEIIKSQQRKNNIEILPITTEHIYALSDLPNHHKDPFDRLLIAQSTSEQIPLLSADSEFRQYQIDLLN
jgi:PIN domain nuclease of toxin-antitoxin system